MAEREPSESPTGPQAGRISQADIEVGRARIVRPDGSHDADAVPDLDDQQLQDLYRWMVLERTFDERMVSLQRRGELGTYASGRGQEASIVGSGYALEGDDWLLGTGREAAAMLLRGVSIRDLVLFWRGVGDAAKFMAEENAMIAISIGSQLPMTTGAAWGMALDDAESVVAAYFGDGATSTGTFHEALNFAGVLGVPAVFFCQNNQYAISTPFEKQTRAGTLAQRAVGYGIEGIRVDGNDVLAVYEAMREARALARGGTPAFVESVTYRMDAHTTSDDPTRYRDESEVEEWERQDPIDRYEAFLRSKGLFDEVDREGIVEEVEAEFRAGLEAADDYPEGDVEAVFEYLYAELPPNLEEQLAAFEALLEERPEINDYIERRPKG